MSQFPSLMAGEAALFPRTANLMIIGSNEMFGPAAAIIPARYNAEAGMVQVNLPTEGMDFHTPFTRRKQAGYGSDEKGGYARDFLAAGKVQHKRFD